MPSLITGSSGLLGRCLVERLEERGDELRLLDLIPPPAELAERHATYCADISDEDTLHEASRGAEVIYHLAAAQRMKPQFADWSEGEIFERNLDGVHKVLAAAEHGGARKVVFVSSSGVYGLPRQIPCREDHPTVPLGDYGRSKLQAEALCLEAVRRGLDVTVLRPMSLFGPQMTGIFVMLYEWVRTARPVYMLGNGRNRVQASSAWDVADTCILAADCPQSAGRILNVASDPEGVPTVEEMVRALIAHAGTGSPLIKVPAALLRAAASGLNLFHLSPIVPEHYILADTNFVLDIDAARDTLGWTPQYDNIRMMRESYDWYASAGEEYRPAPHPMLRLLNLLVPLRGKPT